MSYAGRCDRCGGFYDLPLEHGAAIRTRVVDIFDDTVESRDLCPNCLEELHRFLGGAELGGVTKDKGQTEGKPYQHMMNRFMRKE